MGRFDRLMILASLLLPWIAPLPCRAQPLDLPLAASPLAPSPSACPPTPAPLPGAVVPDPTSRPSQKSSLELSPPPGGEVVVLKPPPLQPGDLCFPINLATALRLSDARPLIVAAAQAGAWVAEAQYEKAKVLWLPSIVMNAAYERHDGLIDFNRGVNIPAGINSLGQADPTSFGRPLDQHFNWFIAGFSLYQVVSVTDAIFQPLAARQTLDARRWDIQTAKNDVLMEVARSYFNVHKYRGQYAGSLYCVEQGRKLLDKINTLTSDLIPRVEVDRARNLLAFLEEGAVSARENWRVASADLTQVLRLDPRAVVRPLEHDHLQITLIDPSRSLDDLLPIGLSNRPELASQQALVQEAAVHIRQEKMRPLLPNILITGFQTPGGMPTQVGIFGTGHGNRMDLWSARDDISTQLVWQLQNFGFGNMALIKKARGEESRAITQQFQIQDMVAAEITEAQANLQSAAARVVQAERSLQTGLVTFRRNLEGLGQTRRFENVLELVYRPQEAIYALQLLKLAFDEYFGTVAEYNQAQFELFHALGYPARDIEFLRPPGDIAPVDTSRPAYLPPVGTGPPPPPR